MGRETSKARLDCAKMIIHFHRPLMTYLINNSPLGDAATIVILIILSLTFASVSMGSLTRATILVHAVHTEFELEDSFILQRL